MLTLYGRLGWQWTINGITYHTDENGKGRYWKRLLLDAEFIAPRDRVKMLRLIKDDE